MEYRASGEGNLVVPQVAVLDFDRSLVDVEASFEAILDAARGTAVDPEQLRQARYQTEQARGSFSPFRYIEDTWGAEQADAVSLALATGGIRSQYYPDVAPFLGRLSANGMPSFVMSYTNHLDGQFGKIISSPYDGGLMIVPGPDKGKYEETFRFDDGFHLHRTGSPSGSICIAQEACLVDDNFASLRNWSGPGYYLLRGKPLDMELPANITPIQTLNELDVVDGRIISDEHARHAQAVAGFALRNSMIVVPVLNPSHPCSKDVWVGEAL
jgi:hypothetical protein